MSLKDLLRSQLRRLYSAEGRGVDAMVRMARASASKELRSQFEADATQSAGHAARLEEVFKTMNAEAVAEACPCSDALIGCCDKAASEHLPEHVRDSALIAAAQAVHANWIAGYTTAHAWAAVLNRGQAGALLHVSLGEERDACIRLAGFAKAINPAALAYAIA